jgi:hypothetical protein
MAVFEYVKAIGWGKGEHFEFSPDGCDLVRALATFVYDDYLKAVGEKSVDREAWIKAIVSFINDTQIEDELSEFYEADLHDWFYDEAQEWYEIGGDDL